MRKILLPLLTLIVGMAIGAAGMRYLHPAQGHAVARPTLTVETFSANHAVPLSITSVQSNLAGGKHYINFSVAFSVMRQNFQAVNGKAGAKATLSPELTARLRNALLNLSRSTSFSQLTQGGGEAVFKQGVSVALQSVFGPGSVGKIYFPNFLLQ